ncbi:hypothetical protein PPTG_17746 [Phytophthora nicotianae INRA-310]|uniref:PUM-HD domain-containing protein n=1 Tax=Phytophthora nicotianae (strain INRA-310) TaxID=761204 RepID=W2PL87_PHYN3|nr:hypothetical protein PPTG_17746 [Phytophthora nicotianae INRA-310]ETN00775.1 hypothetical protein PPTG_17746 [Phytophthora nicotianae INRA-310]
MRTWLLLVWRTLGILQRHIIELIDEFAWTTTDVAVEAAREGNVGRVRSLLDDLEYDIVSVVTAAVEAEQSRVLDTIRSDTRVWCIEIAIGESNQLRIVKLLYSWLDTQGATRRVLPGILRNAASNGLLDILEFAIENYVREHWRDGVLTQSLSSGARHPGRNELSEYLQCSPSFQRLFNNAFYEALENGHEHIAGMIYAAYAAYPARIRDNLLTSLVQLGRTNMVHFIYNKGRVTTAASNRVFMIAAACRHINILMLLLARADISLWTLRRGFKSALRARSFEIGKLLYNTGHISLELLEEEFAMTESVDIMRVLLETEQISADVVRHTFEHAVKVCSNEHQRCRVYAKIVEFLCREEYVSHSAAVWVFMKGVDSNNILLVKAVCKSYTMPPTLGANMLATAIQNDHMGVANFLWGQEWIPYELFVTEFIDAAKYGYLKIVEWFMSYNRASRQAITTAFLAATEAGHIQVARLLSDKQQASTEEISDLIKNASARHHNHVAVFLFEQQ